MPASQSFQINTGKTLKDIMNPGMNSSSQTTMMMENQQEKAKNKIEKDIMKHLLKEHKKEALAEVLPRKMSSRSRTRSQQQPLIPKPLPASKNPLASQTDKKKENDLITKEDLTNKILKYQSNRRFGTIIKQELGLKHSRTSLIKMSVNSLESILHRIRTHLNTRNMDQVFQHMAKVSAKGYEDLICGFGYNIEGFQEILFQNPAFHDAFERWKIENCTNMPQVPPSLQLMYIVASTTYIAHLQNKVIDNEREIKQQKPKGNDVVIKDKLDTIKEEEENTRLKTKYKPGDIII